LKFGPSIRYAALLLALLAGLTGAGPVPAHLSAAAPTFTVNSLGDAIAAGPLDNGICETVVDSPPDNRTCTLRAAIMKANHWPGGGATINIPTGVHELTIAPSGANDETSGDLNVTASTTIAGAGAASAIVDANALDRVLTTDLGITVTLSDVTIRNGGAVLVGGGIRNLGRLIANRVDISGNTAVTDGGGIFTYYSQLTLNNSVVHSNKVSGGKGGGIDAYNSTLYLNDSTISNNSASSIGGGIFVQDSTASLNFSTVSGNLADSDASGGENGGGIFNGYSTVNLRGTLLADNLVGQNANECFSISGSIFSQGYNLLQTSAGCSLSSTTNNKLDIDALLEPLKSNGGPTPTRALLDGSPAIDAVPTGQCLDRFGAPLTADQRGFPRPSGDACDIGAYEGSVPAPLYNRNLIRNGDAETAAGSPTGATVGSPHWTVTSVETPTVVTYGAPGGFPTMTDPGPAARGDNFFAGGGNSSAQLSQTITVTAIASAINAGQVLYDLSGYFGGFSSQDDFAQLSLAFSNGVTLTAPIFIGHVTHTERGDQTRLLPRSTAGVVPPGTIP
jgi:hypothetical protein